MSSVGREIVQVGELLGEYVRGECPTLCVATSCPAQLDASNRCDGSKHKLLKLLLLFCQFIIKDNTKITYFVYRLNCQIFYTSVVCLQLKRSPYLTVKIYKQDKPLPREWTDIFAAWDSSISLSVQQYTRHAMTSSTSLRKRC